VPNSQDGRQVVLDGFRWVGGHADIWRLFVQAGSLAAVVDSLIDPWRGKGVTRVVGIESRGFLLGGAAAVGLGAGFVAIRKSDGLLPGPKLAARTDADYSGRKHELRMQAVLTTDDRVLLVDDWAEQGSQAATACDLVRRTGASFLGTALVVDQLDNLNRSRLGHVTSLVTADELGSDST
jgi:adenine phosphoribosyltransferase